MNRPVIIYIVMIAVLVVGLWAVLAVGRHLDAPADLAGKWSLKNGDQSTGMTVEQSGEFFQIAFDDGPQMDLKLVEQTQSSMDLARGQWRVRFDTAADGRTTVHRDGPRPGEWTARLVDRRYRAEMAGAETARADSGKTEPASPPATAPTLGVMDNEHEETVGRIIAGLWANNSTINNQSISDSGRYTDIRIGNALVGLLADNGAGQQPQDEPTASILAALKKQGWNVDYDWTKHQYLIRDLHFNQRVRRLPSTADTRPVGPLE